MSGFFLTEEGNVGSQISLEDYPVASGCGEEGEMFSRRSKQQLHLGRSGASGGLHLGLTFLNERDNRAKKVREGACRL